MTLEQYLKEKYGCTTSTYNDEFYLEEIKEEYVEDFQLNKSGLSDWELHRDIADFYVNQGYVVRIESGVIFIDGNPQKLFLCASNFGDYVLITVNDFEKR